MTINHLMMLIGALFATQSVSAEPGLLPLAQIVHVSAVSHEPIAPRRTATERELGKLVQRRLSEYIVSPDGRHVAYIAGSGRYFPGAGGPHLQEAWETRSLVLDDQVMNSHASMISQPVFSEDSRHIGYLTEKLGVVDREYIPSGKVDDPATAEIRSVFQLRLSSDGKRVVYVASNYKAAGPSWIVEQGREHGRYASVYSPTFSPDGKHLAYLARDARPGQFVVLDDHEGTRYSSIVGDQNLVFSPDSRRLAYRAGSESGGEREYFVVVNGREGRHYRGLENYLNFSSDSQHFLYLAQISQQRWAVVVDESERRHYEAWAIRNPVFSLDGKHVAYVVATRPDGGERFVVLDEREGKHYSGRDVWLDHALLSSDGKRVVYALRMDGKWRVVADEAEGKRYDGVGEIVFSPDGSSVAYAATEGSKAFVVLDGREGRQYDDVCNLVFSPDGKRLAYAAYRKEDRQWLVVVNEQEGKGYNSVIAKNIYDKYVSRSTDSGSLRFDQNGNLHYLAVLKNRVLLVDEKFDVTEPRAAMTK